MTRSLLLSFALTAVAGTIAGHPVVVNFAPASGLVFTDSVLSVYRTTFDHCDATQTVHTIEEVLDPVAGATIVLPPGNICGIRIELDAPLEIDGYGTNGGTFSLVLDVDRIDIGVSPPIVVPADGSSGGTGIKLASNNWVTASMLGLEPDEHVVVDATHTLHATLRAAIEDHSTAW